MKTLILLTVIIFISSISTYAQEASGDHSHRNHFSVFAGSTKDIDLKEYEYSIGAEYFRKIDFIGKSFGFGFIIEKIGYKEKKFTAMTGIKFVLLSNLKFLLAAGAEITEKDSHGKENIEISNKKWQNEIVFRAGFNYELDMEGIFTISPVINVDYINDKAYLIMGISIGKGF